jgi:4-nitrophenyl phosphatase
MKRPNPTDLDQKPGSIIFDIDGVVYLGTTPIIGATEAIETLADLGWQILFATNNSAATPDGVARQVSGRTGLFVDPSTIITSAMATAAYLADEQVSSAFVVGPEQLEDTIRGHGIPIVAAGNAEAVVVGLDRSLTDAVIEQACQAIRGGARFLATNTDETFPTPDGPVAGAGATVNAVASACAYPIVVCGKPHQPMVNLVSAQLTSDNVWMVGDRLETDIAFAKQAMWKSVLVLSGVTGSHTRIPDGLVPDFVIDSVAELPDLLAKATKSLRDEG